MTDLRSNPTISFENRNSRRHGFHAPAKPNRQQTRKAIGKTKPKANNTGGQSRTRPPKIDFDALTRNIRFRQRARAHELATGDSADTLREKRRWVQQEFDCSRIDGKVTRELHDLYSKKMIGKLEQQRTKAQSLSNAAKEVKQRLEQVFQERSGARPTAGAMGQPLGDDPGDEEADTNHAATNPTSAHHNADNDAVARQWALEHGYELFDATIHGTGVGEGEEGEGEEGEGEEGEGEEGEGEEEEEEEVEVKVEEETYE